MDRSKYLSGISRRRYLAFAAIAIALGSAVGLIGLEASLEYLSHRIETSDRISDKMLTFDPQLGWRLTANWHGHHTHYDFDVHYTTNKFGFRGSFAHLFDPATARRIAVFGDSFVFGIGVNDGQTFVDDLNRHAAPGTLILNLGVPGYATDQEMLLAERVIQSGIHPDETLLVVYLGNDIIDNQWPYSVQGEAGKPYFQLTSHGLVLRNTPVPFKRKSGADAKRTYSSVILAGLPPTGMIDRFLGNLEILRRLGIVWPPPRQLFPAENARFRPSVDLFTALVVRLRNFLKSDGIDFRVALLPGRSFFADPHGYSAQYQNHMRQAILARANVIGVPIIDIGTRLRARLGNRGAARLYYRHEGHLTADGHRAVADILAPALGVENLQSSPERTSLR